MLAALFFTVALLVTNAYFLLGSIPLLVLQHDTPLDARFVRAFFNVYFQAAKFTAGAAAVSYALAGKPVLAAGATSLALLAVLLRRKITGTMEAIGTEIETSGSPAIRKFRRVHLLAIATTLVQLVLIVWTLISFSLN